MTDRIRVGTWNMKSDRPGNTAARQRGVAHQAILLMRRYDLDALALNEASPYVDDLRRYALAHRDELALLTGSRPGEANTAILCDRRVSLTLREQHRVTRDGWITVRGGRTAPKYVPCILLDGWVRIAAVHLPPSTWRTRFFRGPWRRRRAYAQHMMWCRSWGRSRARARRGDTVMLLGDWNAQPNARGKYSPAWLRAQLSDAGAGAWRIVAPAVGTLGRRVIDYAIVRPGKGHKISAARRLNNAGGSDHDLVWWEITR